MEEVEDEIPDLLLPCAICCRTFKPEALERHIKICEKNATKKRKTFDSSKQRMQGTELAEFNPSTALPNKPAEKSPTSKTNVNWKHKHGEVVRAVQSAVVKPKAESPVKSSLSRNPTEKCPYCDRCFGIRAYDGHIRWCKEQKARLHRPPVNNEAKERLEARTKYRAPMILRSRRSITREKYAPSTRKSSDSTISGREPSPGNSREQSPVKSLTREPSPALSKSFSSTSSNSSVPGSARSSAQSPVRKSGVNTPRSAVSLENTRLRRSQRKSVSPVKKVSSSPKIELKSKEISSVPSSEECIPVTNKSDALVPSSSEDQGKLPAVSIGDMDVSVVPVIRNERKNSPRFPSTQRRKFVTPSRPNLTFVFSGTFSTSIEAYDPYASAERQMLDLLNQSDNVLELSSNKIIRPTPIPAISVPAPLPTSPTSAFTRYGSASPPPQKHDTPCPRVESPPNIIDLDDLVISGHSLLMPLSQDKCNNNAGSHNSLDDISLCSSPSFLNDNYEKNQRKNTSSRYRAKLEQAALSLQRSVSLFRPQEEELKTDNLTLFMLETKNDQNTDPSHPKSPFINNNPKPVHEEKHVKLRSQEKISDIKRKKDRTSQSEEELSSPDSAVNQRSYGSKINADSAYSRTCFALARRRKFTTPSLPAFNFISSSFLNRKSPHVETSHGSESRIIELTEGPGGAGDNEGCYMSSSGSESPLPQLCSPMVAKKERSHPQSPTSSDISFQNIQHSPPRKSKFCHECGHKFGPVDKFCCECGVRRLVL